MGSPSKALRIGPMKMEFTTESTEATEEGRDEELRRCRDEDEGRPSKESIRPAQIESGPGL